MRDGQTDGRTDGQTPGDSKDRAYAQRRAVKTEERRLPAGAMQAFAVFD